MSSRGNRAMVRGAAAAIWLSATMTCAPLLLAADVPGAAQLSVFVPDSSAATERFALAEKLERAKEWSKAAEVYQELLDQYRDRVVPAGPAPEQAALYVSVAERATNQLASWPAEGLAVYNGRFQPAADALLQSAASVSDLRIVVDRFALTRAGRTAASRLMQSYWDRGELASAARLAERTASMLAGDEPSRPVLLAQAAMAWHLSGNGARASVLVQQLKRGYPDARGTLGGEQTLLTSALEQVLATAPPPPAAPGSWPSYGGLPDRAAAPDFKGRSDALLFSIDTAATSRLGESGPLNAVQLRFMLNQTLAIYPVYDQRQLFFQDGVNLHALSIDGGMKLPGWPSTSVQISAHAPSGPMLRTLALAPDAIYAVLSDAAAPLGMAAPVREDSTIVCVDRATGRTLWRATSSTISKANASLKAAQFCSPPLVVDDKLYVAARGGRNAQFYDVYVLCLDRKSGNMEWSSYVASGAGLGMADDTPFSVESGLPQLSVHAGRVIVTTNIGAIAAIETSDGTPAWLLTYPRAEVPSSRLAGRWQVRPGMPAQPAARIFAASPAVISGGQVFALPVDGRLILIIDEVDGKLLKQIPRSSVNNADTLVGVTGDTLVLAGERSAIAIQWQQAREEGDQLDATLWAMDFPANALRGRPFLTSDSLFLPTDDRLLRIETAKWKIEQTTPPYPDTWDVTQGPGNVLVTEEHVVVASGKRVNVYTNLETATARLDREVAQQPDCVEPLVRYGELLFAAGEHSGSLQKLRAGLAIAARSPSQAAARDRLFSAALTCAVRLATQETGESRWQEFLQLAQQAAQSPSQHVQFHFAAATMHLRHNDGPASLAQLQAVLDDAQQRTVTYRDTDGSTRSSAEIARRQIQQLKDRYGSSIYQALEQKAREMLSRAQASRDVPALLEIAHRYPNSSSAPLALYSAGQVLESQDNLVEAASTYRQLVQSYNTHADVTMFVEALARVYAAIPGKATIAASRLAQASAAHNNPSTRGPIRLPTGRVIQPGSFAEVAAAIRSAAGMQRAMVLPDFGLPPMGTAPFQESMQVNLPAERILPSMPGTQLNHTRAVVLSPDGTIVIAGQRGEIMRSFPRPRITSPSQVVWIDRNSLLLSNAREILALSLETGQELWRLVPEELPDVSEVSDEQDAEVAPDLAEPAVQIDAALAEQVLQARRGGAVINLIGNEQVPDGITEIRVAAGKVILGTSTGRLVAVAASDGRLLWQIRPGAGAVMRVACSDDFTAAKVGGPGKSMLLCVDNDSGRLVYVRNFARDPLQNILLTDDGQLIYTTLGTLASKDLFDQGERLIFEIVPENRPNSVIFVGQDRVDQLLLVDDVIVAGSDRGTNVRLYSRYTGKQIAPGGKETNVGVARLPQEGRVSRSHLVPADPYVYAHNQQAILAVNVQRNETPRRQLPGDVINLKSVIPGARHLVAFEQPLRRENEPTIPELRLFAFSRSLGSSGESGRLDHMLTIRPEGGIASYQLIEGGLYLVTGDKRLLFHPARPQ